MGSQLHYKLNFFLLLYSVLKNTAVRRNNVFEGQLLVCRMLFLDKGYFQKRLGLEKMSVITQNMLFQELL